MHTDEMDHYTDILQLRNGRSIPIHTLTINIGDFNGEYDNVYSELARNGVEIDRQGYVYRCLTKEISRGGQSPFDAYKERVKDTGIDRPINRWDDFQTTSDHAELTWFHMGDVKSNPGNNISIILTYNPLNDPNLNAQSDGDPIQAVSLFDQITHLFIDRHNKELDDFLIKTLDSIVEIHWKK